MEGDGNGVADRKSVSAALAHGAVAVGELDAAGAVAHELDDAAGGADFVGVRAYGGHAELGCFTAAARPRWARAW